MKKITLLISILMLLPLMAISKDKKIKFPDKSKFSFTVMESNEEAPVVLKYEGSSYEIVYNLTQSDLLAIQAVIPKLKEQEAQFKKTGGKKKVYFGDTLLELKDEVSNNLLRFSSSCANNRIKSTIYIGSQDPNKAHYYQYQDSATITAKKLDKLFKKVMKEI